MKWTFGGGKSADLVELHQSLTYEGLLEGLPTREENERDLARLRVEHQRPGGLLIEPAQRPIASEAGGPWLTSEHVQLPSVLCIGRFRAFGKRCIWSELTIAWFQDVFALPIDPTVLDTLRTVDWGDHACEYDP